MRRGKEKGKGPRMDPRGKRRKEKGEGKGKEGGGCGTQEWGVDLKFNLCLVVDSASGSVFSSWLMLVLITAIGFLWLVMVDHY